MSSLTKQNRPEKMDSLLSVRKSGITEEGVAWARAALDPFHDEDVAVAGYPDTDNMQTVTMVKNFQYELTKPAGAAGSWDAHVFTLPFIGEQVYNAGSIAADGGLFTDQNPAVAQTYTLSTVNVAKGDAGEILYPDSPLTRTNFSITAAANTDLVLAGTFKRVIALAIEVVDTTPVVSKAGALTVYTHPVAPREILQSVTNSTPLAGAGIGENNHFWPGSQAECVYNPNAKQWEARRGAYLVCGMSSIENPFRAETKAIRTFTPTYSSQYVGDGLVTAYTSAGTGDAVATLGSQTIPFTRTGIYLSGLHNDASFLIKTRFIIEIAPNINSSLVYLATPSPGLDIKALQLYSMVRSQLPIAVPVSDNASGDWFRHILKLIERFAPIVGGALPIAYAGPAGQVIGQMAGIVSQRTAPKKKKNGNGNGNGRNGLRKQIE